MVDDAALAALGDIRTIDLTTIGRRSGRRGRVEIWWFRIDERFIITGTPGKRDWYANVLADPQVVIHTSIGDFSGRASPVLDDEFRRRVFTDPEVGWYRTQADLDRLVADAPMIEIGLD